MVPDATTFSDAIKVLKKYDLWDKIPGSVRKYFEKADPNEETPNVSDFKRVGVKVHNLILANNEVICKAAEERARELGINAAILSTTVEGEAKEVGIVLASIAKEIEKRNRPFKLLLFLLQVERQPLLFKAKLEREEEIRNLL